MAFGTLSIVFDGFLVPVLAQKYLVAAEGGRQLAAAIFEYNFLLTLTLLGPAFFAYTIGIALFSVSLLKTRLFKKWLAMAGLVIGVIGFLGYLAGAFGPYWVTSLLFTPYIILVAIWVLILGIFQYRAQEA